MGRRTWKRCVLPLLFGLAFARLPEARELPDETSTGSLGPMEFAPGLPYGFSLFGSGAFLGNVGSPRSAVPETRIGLATLWQTASALDGVVRMDAVSVMVEAHVEMFDALELGLDVEILQNLGISPATAHPAGSEFGFVTPRVKWAFVHGPIVTVAIGTGVLLPTSTVALWNDTLPVAVDPGLFFAVRPADMLSLNASVPVTVLVCTAGKDQVSALLTPTIGLAAMPLRYIGGVVDLQLQVWAGGGEKPVERFRAMILFLGARSRFLPMMTAEVGAILPLAGEYADLADFGLGVRLAATPDVL